MTNTKSAIVYWSANVDLLLDEGSPFLEIGELAGEGLYEGVAPGAGIVTGVGLIQGRACMVIANDPTVKGGTYFGMTCKKHVRAQRFAWQHHLPCITLVDSGGAFLPDQANIFPDEGLFGSIFQNQVGMSADGIAQIAVVLGACTAGGAYIPSCATKLSSYGARGTCSWAGHNWSRLRPAKSSTQRVWAVPRCTAAPAA